MRVYVGRMSEGKLDDALRFVEWDRYVKAGTRIFVKPNLTWRDPTPGVTTTLTFIQSVVAVLKERTPHIIIGEADGGYHSFKAEEAFERHGLYDLQKRFNLQVVNLSNVPSESRTVHVAGQAETVELPCLLLNEVDVFITLPVPKVHVMTQVSLGFKNQWGCQPGTMRLRGHPGFARKVLAINKLLHPRLTLVDGTYFLDKSGPMFGEAVPMNILIASDSVGAADLTCCEIMGINPWRIGYLRLARQEGMMPASLDEVKLNAPIADFCTRKFRLERRPIDWVARLAFRSHLGTRLLYDSTLAGPLHRTLYKVRKNRFIGRLLYGSMGPPNFEIGG